MDVAAVPALTLTYKSPGLLISSDRRIHKVQRLLPDFDGRPIRISFKPSLTAHRGKLLSGFPDRGIAVHAASFIRQRSIVLESELLRRPRRLHLIILHELFHFVWIRLSNERRRSFAELLQHELAGRARGELGESAAVRKEAMHVDDPIVANRRWRDYLCESFCDTAAWFHNGFACHEFVTLARRWQTIRRQWFATNFPASIKC